jgi:hypothetical protein
MSKEIPTFRTPSFLFEDKVPEHIEQVPKVPNYAGCFAVFGAIVGMRPYPLALDVPTEVMARDLAHARMMQQEESVDVFGYTDDIYIQFPDGKKERTYYGRTVGSEQL